MKPSAKMIGEVLTDFANNVATGTLNFVSLIVKIIILKLASKLSALVNEKKKLVQLSFNSNLQVIDDISSDLQELPKYFNGRAIIVFFKILLTPLDSSVFQ